MVQAGDQAPTLRPRGGGQLQPVRNARGDRDLHRSASGGERHRPATPIPCNGKFEVRQTMNDPIAPARDVPASGPHLHVGYRSDAQVRESTRPSVTPYSLSLR